jgi:hypothetical protein
MVMPNARQGSTRAKASSRPGSRIQWKGTAQRQLDRPVPAVSRKCCGWATVVPDAGRGSAGESRRRRSRRRSGRGRNRVTFRHRPERGPAGSWPSQVLVPASASAPGPPAHHESVPWLRMRAGPEVLSVQCVVRTDTVVSRVARMPRIRLRLHSRIIGGSQAEGPGSTQRPVRRAPLPTTSSTGCHGRSGCIGQGRPGNLRWLRAQAALCAAGAIRANGEPDARGGAPQAAAVIGGPGRTPQFGKDYIR